MAIIFINNYGFTLQSISSYMWRKKMRLNLAVLFYVFSLCALLIAASSTCYYPDGGIATDHEPCNSSAENSACCSADSVCLSNSYCFSRTGRIIRSSCTDRQWQSSACPYFCRDGNSPLLHRGGGKPSLFFHLPLEFGYMLIYQQSTVPQIWAWARLQLVLHQGFYSAAALVLIMLLETARPPRDKWDINRSIFSTASSSSTVARVRRLFRQQCLHPMLAPLPRPAQQPSMTSRSAWASVFLFWQQPWPRWGCFTVRDGYAWNSQKARQNRACTIPRRCWWAWGQTRCMNLMGRPRPLRN